MRPFSTGNATKVLITVLAMLLSLTGFAEARDWNDGRQIIRRPHYDRSYHDRRDYGRHHRDRSETITSRDARRYDRDGRRHGRDRLSGRSEYRRHDDRRISRERRFDRRVPEYRERANRRRNEIREYRERAYAHRDRERGRYRSDRRSGYYYRDEFPSRTGAGTYFGGLSAWRDPGNGTYFHSERYDRYDDRAYGYDDRDEGYRSNRTKIIRVNPSSAGRACSWESGVCVIRR